MTCPVQFYKHMSNKQHQTKQTISTDGEDAATDGVGQLFVARTERWVTCQVTQHQSAGQSANSHRPCSTTMHTTCYTTIDCINPHVTHVTKISPVILLIKI